MDGHRPAARGGLGDDGSGSGENAAQSLSTGYQIKWQLKVFAALIGRFSLHKQLLSFRPSIPALQPMLYLPFTVSWCPMRDGRFLLVDGRGDFVRWPSPSCAHLPRANLDGSRIRNKQSRPHAWPRLCLQTPIMPRGNAPRGHDWYGTFRRRVSSPVTCFTCARTGESR